MAEVVRYVDPDASGAGDGTSWTDAYTSLSAWEAAEQTDLVTDGDWHHVYCRSSAGSADTTTVTIDGWTTGADNYILIEAADGDEAVKSEWDTSRYRLSASAVVVLGVYVSYVTIDGLQIEETGTRRALYLNAANTVVKNCRLRANNTYATSGYALGMTGGTTVENCICYGYGDNGVANVIYHYSGTNYIYNCVVYGGVTEGIHGQASGSYNAINCAVFNNGDDFGSYGRGTIDHCASDDGDGTNSVSPSGSDWGNEFSDPANGDFTLLNTGNCYQGGTTITGGPTYDIDGDEWHATTPSIGVDEYVSAGGTTVSVDSASHSHSLDAVVLTQLHNLSVGGMSHSHSIDGVNLVSSILLAVDDLAHSQSLDGVVLTQLHNLAVADLDHSHTFGGVSITQLHNLTVDDLKHSQSLDSVSVTIKGSLIVDSLSHVHALNGVNVTQKVNVFVDDLAHAHTVDGVTVVTGQAIAVDGLGHAHSLGAVTIEQKHILEVQSLAHAQGLDAVSFGLANGLVTVTFSVKYPGVQWSDKQPLVVWSSKKPGVEWSN